MTEKRPDDVLVPEAPDVPGLRFRHFRGADDLPGIVAVIDAAHRADAVDFFLTVDDLANELDNGESTRTPRGT